MHKVLTRGAAFSREIADISNGANHRLSPHPTGGLLQSGQKQDINQA